MEPELKELMAAVRELGAYLLALPGFGAQRVEDPEVRRLNAAVEREAAAFAVRLIEQIQQRASSMASFDGNAALGPSEIGAFADRWRKVLEVKP